ncbi:MAG: cytochrome C [Proteobacteria bacterium]|nr:cytochrome C [Pseudomonadota bacterium]
MSAGGAVWAGAGLLLATAFPAAALDRPESADVAQNYVLFCGGCHGLDGAGVRHRVPALRDTVGRFLRADGGRELLLRFPGVTNSQLSDAGLAAVMNWCVARFGGDDRSAAPAPYTAAEVRAARSEPLLNVRVSRAAFMRRAGVPADEAGEY